jgi:hypothetical protein
MGRGGIVIEGVGTGSASSQVKNQSYRHGCEAVDGRPDAAVQVGTQGGQQLAQQIGVRAKGGGRWMGAGDGATCLRPTCRNYLVCPLLRIWSMRGIDWKLKMERMTWI